MRRILLAIILSVLPCAALPQGCGQGNPNCVAPTPPPGDSSNRIATTEFVQSAIVTPPGVLNVAAGGTGRGTFTTHGILVGNLVSPLNVTAAMTDGQILIGATGADPAPQTITGSVAFTAGGVTTLSSVVTAGSCGSGTQVPALTYNAEGRITAVTCTTITPAFASLTGQASLAQLPTIATSTVLGNFSGGSTSPLAAAIPSCASDGTHALTNNGASGFNCTLVGSAGSSGNRVLLNTLTAANSAVLSDTTSFTATYTRYEIVLENLRVATNGAGCLIRIHSGGAFQAGSYINSGVASRQTGASPTNIAATVTAVQCTQTTTTGGMGISNAVLSSGINGTVTVTAPTLATGTKTWVGHYGYFSQGNGVVDFSATGIWNTAAAIDGFQVLAGAGNLTTGKVYVYGIIP
jgi:hypothetical protein